VYIALCAADFVVLVVFRRTRVASVKFFRRFFSWRFDRANSCRCHILLFRSALMMPNTFSSKTIPFLLEAGQQTDPNWLDVQQDRYEKLVKTPFVAIAVGLNCLIESVLD
jgi:hypothetical protein